jgi:limonene 1,2-monooxygenase
MDRKQWRLVANAHIAETDEQAMADVRLGERLETVTYFEDTLGRPPGRSDNPLADGVRMGTTLVGSPDTVARGIERLIEYSQGGIGGIMFRAHDWADWEQTKRSYELFARYVMPRFQGSADMPAHSNAWVKENRKTVFGPNVEAIRKAYVDAGRAVPENFSARVAGARDPQPERAAGE